jgi:uncharacterized OB-fold protein
VQLDEGSQLITNVLGAGRPAIGAPVRVVFGEVGGESRAYFELVRDSE